MHKSLRWILSLAAVMLCLLGTAVAQEAEDITRACVINGGKGSSLKDESYRTVWESSRKNGYHALVVEAPEGQTIGGLLIRWRSWPVALVMQAKDEAGEWSTIGGCEADYLAQYIPVDNRSCIRLFDRDTTGRTRLEISSITVLGPGTPPRDVQIWQKPSDHVELMLLATHPDDEVLWFGGLLPTYAGQQGREVLVVNASYSRFDRRLELLDCLWTCGVRTYPVFLGYPDICTNQRDKVLQLWKWDQVVSDVAALYRRHRPDVVMLHAEGGESGHGAHIVMSQAGREAALTAADAAYDPDTAAQYGTWEVPKIYLHLYEENPVQMDWHTPLEQFGGLTAYEAADRGFQCHRSQIGGGWEMKLGGENDNSLFGLWRSLVGPDVEKADLFENIPSRAMQ